MFYRLFIIERLPYQINEKVTWMVLIIVTSILFMHCIALISTIRSLFDAKPSRLTEVVARLLEYVYYTRLRAVCTFLLKHALISYATLKSDGALLYSFPNKYAVYLIKKHLQVNYKQLEI